MRTSPSSLLILEAGRSHLAGHHDRFNARGEGTAPPWVRP